MRKGCEHSSARGCQENMVIVHNPPPIRGGGQGCPLLGGPLLGASEGGAVAGSGETHGHSWCLGEGELGTCGGHAHVMDIGFD